MYGYWAIPDAPTSSKARWLNETDREMAVNRMQSHGRAPMKKLTLAIWKRILTTWPVYLFCTIFIAHVLGIRIYSYFNLWLEDTGLYTREEINVIPSAGYGMQICFTLSYAWASDAIRMRWPLIIFACVVAIIGTIILSVWPDSNLAAMYTGWLLTFCETGAGALIITWINKSFHTPPSIEPLSSALSRQRHLPSKHGYPCSFTTREMRPGFQSAMRWRQCSLR